jgi:hypothetical protein
VCTHNDLAPISLSNNSRLLGEHMHLTAQKMKILKYHAKFFIGCGCLETEDDEIFGRLHNLVNEVVSVNTKTDVNDLCVEWRDCPLLLELAANVRGQHLQQQQLHQQQQHQYQGRLFSSSRQQGISSQQQQHQPRLAIIRRDSDHREATTTSTTTTTNIDRHAFDEQGSEDGGNDSTFSPRDWKLMEETDVKHNLERKKSAEKTKYSKSSLGFASPLLGGSGSLSTTSTHSNVKGKSFHNTSNNSTLKSKSGSGANSSSSKGGKS